MMNATMKIRPAMFNDKYVVITLTADNGDLLEYIRVKRSQAWNERRAIKEWANSEGYNIGTVINVEED